MFFLYIFVLIFFVLISEQVLLLHEFLVGRQYQHFGGFFNLLKKCYIFVANLSYWYSTTVISWFGNQTNYIQLSFFIVNSIPFHAETYWPKMSWAVRYFCSQSAFEIIFIRAFFVTPKNLPVQVESSLWIWVVMFLKYLSMMLIVFLKKNIEETFWNTG